MVIETQLFHLLRLVQISSVDHEFPCHGISRALPIQLAKGIPVGADKGGIRIAQRIVGVLVIVELRKNSLGSRHGFRVCGVHDGTLFDEAFDDFQSWGKANIVRVGLKSESEYGDALAFHHPQRLVNLLEKMLDALLVDAFGSLQDVEINTNFGCQINESLHVFRKTEAAVAQPSLKKLSTYARVQTHCVRDFFDVSANFFAQVRDYVGVTDF